jgi:hypothetical protein
MAHKCVVSPADDGPLCGIIVGEVSGSAREASADLWRQSLARSDRITQDFRYKLRNLVRVTFADSFAQTLADLQVGDSPATQQGTHCPEWNLPVQRVQEPSLHGVRSSDKCRIV